MTRGVPVPVYVSPIETYVAGVLQQAPDRLNGVQRQERVIAATIRACAYDGPLDFKMADIAEVAGASTATIYREFENAAAILRHATLKAVSILTNEWALISNGDHDDLGDLAQIEAFLLRFGETYRHPYSGWLLRADLAIAANNDAQVTNALLAFQNQIVAFGASCVPTHAFGFASPYDLVQVLLGATQLPIIHAILAAPAGFSEASMAQSVDLHQSITSILAWLGITKPTKASTFVEAPYKTKQVFAPMPKSAIQIHCEQLLSQPIERTDHLTRRAKMFAATMTDCAAVGLEGTSISRIAAIARVSTASIYKEFADKDALIQASIASSIPIYAAATMMAVEEPDPKVRIGKMLVAQAMTLTDPFGAWLFRHYTKLEASHNPAIKQQAQTARAQSGAFWNQQFARLVAEGHLTTTDFDLTRDVVFGGIHRRSVLARLLQNDNAFVWREVEASVSAATDMLFRLYGLDATRATPALLSEFA